jgi:hypothetical protein
MGLRSNKLYNPCMTDITPRFLLARAPLQHPFDRIGLASLAWAGAFLCLTAVVLVLVR